MPTLGMVLALSCHGAPAGDIRTDSAAGTGDTAGDTAGDTGLTLPECAPLALVTTGEWRDDALADPAEQVSSGNNGGPGLALGDVDGDGWLDAVLAVPIAPSLLLLNDGTGALEIVARSLPPANAAAAADLDGDGDLDIWLGTGPDQDDVLLRNDGAGGFSEERLPDSAGQSYGGTFGDLDGDGDLDLLVSRYIDVLDMELVFSGGAAGAASALYLNRGGSLVRADEGLPAEVVGDLSFQAQLIDADGDGDLDAYLSNDFGTWASPNRLLLNDGRARFSLAEHCGCELEMFAMGAAVGDADGDGPDDLYVTNLDSPALLLGLGGGSFADSALASGAAVPASDERLASWGSAFVDLDQDGWQDLAVTFGALYHELTGDSLENYSKFAEQGWVDAAAQPDLLLHNLGGTFEDISHSSGFEHDGVGRALAVGDLDRDGVPDLVTAGVPYLRTWRTEGGCGPGVTLRGPVGLVAEVEAGPLRYIRQLLPSTTFSSSAPELYLGLAGQDGAERITARWPDGSSQSWEDVPAGAVLEVAR